MNNEEILQKRVDCLERAMELARKIQQIEATKIRDMNYWTTNRIWQLETFIRRQGLKVPEPDSRSHPGATPDDECDDLL